MNSGRIARESLYLIPRSDQLLAKDPTNRLELKESVDLGVHVKECMQPFCKKSVPAQIRQVILHISDSKE